MGSDKFKINTGDLLNVLKNGLLVAVAAFITYIMNENQVKIHERSSYIRRKRKERRRK